MKFTKDTPGKHTITSYTAVAVTIDGVEHRSSLIVNATRLLVPWHCDAVTDLDDDAVVMLLRDEPEVVILGSGREQRFPPPLVLGAFAARGVGLEIMTTAAACRTYNVLIGESRRVTAGLILP